MPLKLTPDAMRAIWPRAPQPIINAFVAKQHILDRAGVTHTRPRLAFFVSQIEHETAGFTIPGLEENLRYTAERIAEVWPSRFPSAAAAQPYARNARALANKVYNGRMGNRPGSDDGYNYRGRGGPQITGRDGYREVGKRCGLPLEAQPDIAALPDYQPDIAAGFWTWKNLNAKADVGDFRGATKLWNGGLIGYADRQAKLEGNDPIIARLVMLDGMREAVKKVPGEPKPQGEVIEEATRKERAARNAGGAGAAVGAGSEAAKQTGTVQPDAPMLSPVVTWTIVGVGVAVALVAIFMIVRKRRAIAKTWF